MPQTKAYGSTENPIEKIFWGRLELEKATSFYQFQKKGSLQRLIHHFKYKGIKEIGITMGSLMANDLQKQGFFEGIDYLVPVPIHQLKLKKRGYNQSQYLAEGVSKVTQIPVLLDLIEKRLNTESQTRKGRFKRWKNVKSSFHLKNSSGFEGHHILLLDDVLTTGSTLEACALELKKIEGLRLSLLTLAYTT
ncbi:MAG: phosphoribosyltransferase family protein [Vicingaceae bacterium]